MPSLPSHLHRYLPAAFTAAGERAPDGLAAYVKLTTLWAARFVYKETFMARLKAAAEGASAASGRSKDASSEGGMATAAPEQPAGDEWALQLLPQVGLSAGDGADAEGDDTGAAALGGESSGAAGGSDAGVAAILAGPLAEVLAEAQHRARVVAMAAAAFGEPSVAATVAFAQSSAAAGVETHALPDLDTLLRCERIARACLLVARADTRRRAALVQRLSTGLQQHAARIAAIDDELGAAKPVADALAAMQAAVAAGKSARLERPARFFSMAGSGVAGGAGGSGAGATPPAPAAAAPAVSRLGARRAAPAAAAAAAVDPLGSALGSDFDPLGSMLGGGNDDAGFAPAPPAPSGPSGVQEDDGLGDLIADDWAVYGGAHAAVATGAGGVEGVGRKRALSPAVLEASVPGPQRGGKRPRAVEAVVGMSSALPVPAAAASLFLPPSIPGAVRQPAAAAGGAFSLEEDDDAVNDAADAGESADAPAFSFDTTGRALQVGVWDPVRKIYVRETGADGEAWRD